MTILTDFEIAHMAHLGMIDPYLPSLTDDGVSAGQSSMGYDMRLGTTFTLITPRIGALLDPKQPDERCFRTVTHTQPFLLPARGYLLGVSVEHFCMPPNVLGLVIGKSTYARVGLSVNCTPMEPGWRGWLTLELANQTDLPIMLYPNEGIAQVLFFVSETIPLTGYGQRKYQDQAAVPVLSKGKRDATE